MPALYTVQSRASGGGQIAAADINQLVNTLNGNQNTPVNVRTTDPIAYTFQGQNTDAAGKTLLLYGPDGTTVILRSQGNGVVASPDGTAAAPIVTTTHAQTVSGKTFTAPALTNPVVSGAGATAAGTLGFSGTSLLVGDGTVNRAVNVGPWVAFTPTLNQGGAVAATVNLARYAIVGKLAIVQILLTALAGGGAGNITIAGLPAAITALTANNSLPVGTFYYSGVANRSGAVIQTTTTSLAFFVDNNAGYLGGAPAVTLANTHVLAVNAAWEIA